MRRIVTPEQMRAIEARAFALGVPPLLLMESAARAAHDVVRNALGGLAGKDVLYLAGPGNNGGDGLAMARLCAWDGGKPRIFLTEQPRTPEAAANLEYAKALRIPVADFDLSQLDSFSRKKPEAVVDAIFGTGFRGALPARLIPLANVVGEWNISVFSVDAPSGLNSLTGKAEGAVFRAAHTVALGHLKTGLCLGPDTGAVGTLHVVPIGIPQAAYTEESEGFILSAEAADLPGLLPNREKDAHKGDAGRVLMYMGSMGLAGAAAMASQAALAALRSGAGLVTVVCPYEVIPIIQTLVPNAMCIQIEKTALHPPARDVFALGCGLGQTDPVWQNIVDIWRHGERGVWDADALNLLAKHPMKLGDSAVITPHPGEAARLLGVSVGDVTADPLAAAKALQEKYGCCVVLKGHASVIFDGKRTAVNLAGSPALAKGGSGDALTGILSGLMAQMRDKSPFDCAVAACLWLGLAGEEAERKHGVLSPLTQDVIAAMPKAERRAEHGGQDPKGHSPNP